MRYIFLLIILFVSNCLKANEEKPSSISVVAVTITDNNGAASNIFTSFSHFSGETIRKEGVYSHESLFYVDEEYDGDLMIQLFEGIYPDGLYITAFNFKNADIIEGMTKTQSNFSVEVKYISKADMSDSPGFYCCNNSYAVPMGIINAQKGDILGKITVSDGKSSTPDYYISVNSEDIFLSVYTIKNFFPHLLGIELYVSFTQKYFPKYGSEAFQGLYILEPPPPLTVTPPEILCNGGSVKSLTISGFPDNATDASLRIDITKLGSKASYQGAIPDTTINGVDYYWLNQQTAILTDEEINPVNNSITLDAESNNFEIDEGLYEINVFYYDGVSSLCPSTTFFTVDEPDPLELRLDLET
jgi:hypothetical protein